MERVVYKIKERLLNKSKGKALTKMRFLVKTVLQKVFYFHLVFLRECNYKMRKGNLIEQKEEIRVKVQQFQQLNFQ